MLHLALITLRKIGVLLLLVITAAPQVLVVLAFLTVRLVLGLILSPVQFTLNRLFRWMMALSLFVLNTEFRGNSRKLT